jgi:hypothetical protein
MRAQREVANDSNDDAGGRTGWSRGHLQGGAHLPYTARPKTLRQSLAVASQCRAEGDGLSRAIARQQATFTVVAADASGLKLEYGGDVFRVDIRGASAVRARVFDNEDGTYTVRYIASTSGAYDIGISLNGLTLEGSPYRVSVITPRPDPTKCHVSGDALQLAVAREPAMFEISFIDGLGQHTHAEVRRAHSDASLVPSPVDYLTDGAGARARIHPHPSVSQNPCRATPHTCPHSATKSATPALTQGLSHGRILIFMLSSYTLMMMEQISWSDSTQTLKLGSRRSRTLCNGDRAC